MALSSPTDPVQVEIKVEADAEGQRIDSYLGKHPDAGLTRSRVQKLIDDGLVLLNGEKVSKKSAVKSGDSISITVVPPPPSEIKAENIPLNIVYEDDHLAVINKPAGMVVHPGAGNFSGTLVNALLFHFKNLPSGSGPDRPGIVHRLDKDTSGLLLIAKTEEVYQKLQKAIQARKVKRTYLALVCGHVSDDNSTIDLPIGRSIKNRKKMAVTNLSSREAVTSYSLLKRYRSYDLLDVNLQTGRTHQIRVHFSHLGHPVFGDGEYGGRENWHRGIFAPERPLAKKLLTQLSRQALHARQIELTHPVTGEEMSFEAKTPEDFVSTLDLLDTEGS